MTAPTPRPGILDIAPYKGGDSSIEGVERVIKLASNEGALGPSPLAVDAIKAAAGDVHRYPDGHCTALRQAIAERYELDPARLVFGAGSDELLSLICQAYAGEGDEVLYSAHGFLMYGISAKAAGATPVTAPETNLTADVDNLLAAVTERTKILFLANPNNPTGTWLPRAEVERLRDGLRDDILLVLDSAYAEYMDDERYSAGVELVESTPNTVMTRTFSKIYALGGVRLGWAYAPEDVIGVINRVRGPFNVNTPAQAAGLAAFHDREFLDRSRRHNATWRSWTEQQVRGLGCEVPQSAANFVLVRFPGPAEAEAADGFLRARGIIVRRMAAYGLPDSLRVSIGLEDEMRTFVDALAAFREGAAQ